MPLSDEDFEQELRAALRREAAPADFAAKLERRLPAPIWRRPAVWAIAAAVLFAALLPPAVLEYRRERQAQALEARRELIVALRITNVKLRQTKERVERATRHTL
jgi:hypothetical protein